MKETTWENKAQMEDWSSRNRVQGCGLDSSGLGEAQVEGFVNIAINLQVS